MKRNNSIFTGWECVILALVAVSFGLLGPAYCQTDGIALLLQQTPPEAGKISPGVGVHRFELHTELTLTAIPKPGYQFVYWMGDVSDTTANNTILYLDAPKIVIAVFERAEYELLDVEAGLQPQSRPVGGMTASGGDYSRRGGGGAGRRPIGIVANGENGNGEDEDFPVPPEGNDFPVPPEGNDFPVPEPIPEPATILLLSLSSLALLRKRRA